MKLEHLCRYIARPPISTERLTLDERGRIPYRLRHPYRDGTTHIVFTPTSFLERLCALIPRPCKHLLSYHGVLAPASSWRPEIIPRGAFESVPSTSRPTTRTSLERRLRWTELIRRAFDADVLHCEGGYRLERDAAPRRPAVRLREYKFKDRRSPDSCTNSARGRGQGDHLGPQELDRRQPRRTPHLPLRSLEGPPFYERRARELRPPLQAPGLAGQCSLAFLFNSLDLLSDP